jgi:hypothetical protein
MPQPNPDPWIAVDQGGVPIAYDPVAPIRVYRYDGVNTLTPLNSVECVSIERHAGTDPGHAGFRYKFDGFDPAAPQTIEDALSTESTLPGAVGVNDRLVVTGSRWDGMPVYLFDGFATDFRLELDAGGEMVDFFAIGVATRLWDTPIPGAKLRDSTQPTTPGADTDTDLVAQFNPKGMANATDVGADSHQAVVSSDTDYPVFLDKAVCLDREIGRKWTLPMAMRYLVQTRNREQQYVNNPKGSVTDALLISREPIAGLRFDPGVPSSYTAKPIVVPDRPITGKDWPTVLHEMLRALGFDMGFQLGVGPTLFPLTTLVPFLRQAGPVKHLYLQPEGSDLNLYYSNTTRARVGRDVGEVVNAWEVHGALKRYEVSVLLIAGFPMAAGDATAANLPRYKLGSDYAVNSPDAYRVLVYDETGDGHYLNGTGAVLNTPGSLSAVFGAAPVPRRRPALNDLISRGPFKVREPKLAYSLTYAGAAPPCVWDKTATDWQEITGGWQLLKDQLGVRITTNDPNAWTVGDGHADGAPKKLNFVEKMAAGGNLTFRMTCVIEGDQVVKGKADRQQGFTTGRDPSPITDTIRRVVDARDRYLYQQVHPSSEYWVDPGGGDPVIARDDTALALAEATSLRSATEGGVLQGTVSIPYLTDYYRIGDRIADLAGRGLGFRTDGGDKYDTPVLPMVEGYRWDLLDGQHTTLFLSDEATIRHKLERRVKQK